MQFRDRRVTCVVLCLSTLRIPAAPKPGYVNFKNAVWHSAFYKLLESIVAHSKTGIWTECGDGKQRWLFPCGADPCS
ncbi:hypothetical protein B0H13DRAFT_1592431 [Mycena leptocephala]|nr:hypothetical protein B0H13DRAFT_1592431 [Mycena leptocephala]